jgi:GDPmannose 4,6-dehydratase
MAFRYIGVELDFTGDGVEEKGIVKSCTNPDYQLEIGKEVVAVDPRYFRPTEVDLLIGDPTKAKEKLGWVPEIALQELVDDMMQSDLHLMSREEYLKKGGYRINNYYE